MTALVLLLALALGGACASPGPPGPREDIAFLASPGLGGRLAGSPGEQKAAAYLAERLAAIGAEPLPGRDDFHMPFEFTAGSRDEGTRLRLPDGRSFEGPGQVSALSFSDSGSVTAGVVFAGYGLVLPEGREVAYDSYAGLDVKDKIVVVLRYFPEEAPADARGELARYSSLRYKALQARERGARALLVLTGPSSPNAGKTVPLTFDAAIAGSGLLAASAGAEVAAALFETFPERDLARHQAALDGGDPHVAGFAVPDLELTLEVAVAREERTALNVAGVLTPPAAPGPASWVVLGAHYDHLGHGEAGSSLAREDERGAVHPGADDNASGVAAVLEAGRLLADAPHARGIVLAFWSGEELGLLGSSRFLDEAELPAGEIAAYLNFDMVGRSRERRVSVQATGTSPIWEGLLAQANAQIGLELELQADPYLPTDSTAFDRREVPTLNFFTGGHADYHRPSDTADRLDYASLAEIAALAAGVARAVANEGEAPGFVRVERRRAAGPGRATLRAYTGTIPDYASAGSGLRLAGVAAGGPAEAAGLRAGDVLVEFAGQQITNIYDYTYALDAVKIGVSVGVVYLRDGERRETRLRPEARR